MASKSIIDWSKAPVDATHCSPDGSVWCKDINTDTPLWRGVGAVKYYGSVWTPFYSGLTPVDLIPRPAPTPSLLPNRKPVTSTAEMHARYNTEHSMCCGTTCDRTAVARYIERLETVADAAHHLEASGVLAGTPRMQNLKMALEELK